MNSPMHCRLGMVVAACLLSVAPVTDAAADDARVFRAGAATANITPPLGQLIVGGWQPIPATYVHDELHARCLVLDDGNTTLAFVICDNVGIPREVYDAAREIIAEQTDVPAGNVLFAATHTHSATTARGEVKSAVVEKFTPYQQFLVQRMADVVRIALTNREPARIGWGSVDVPEEVFNRRWFVTDEDALKNPFGGVDKVRMNPSRGSASLLRPAGPIDPEVSFLSVQSTDGRPICLMANYSLHYVGGVRSGHISADYFGMFAGRIAELLSAEKQTPPFVGIMTNGTSGDINNINFRETGTRHQPYEKMQQVADLVAQRVAEAHESITFQDWVPLSAKASELTLAVRKPDQEMLSWFDKVDSTPEGETTWHSRERTYSKRVRGIAEGPDEVSILLQTFAIGDLGITAVPFETFVQTGLELKEKSPFAHEFTIELANGSYGYLPTPEQHELGGYETWLGTNYVQKDATVKIVDRLLEMFEALKAERKQAE
jgi:neutral ceramidase